MLVNPINETESNRKGIEYVVQRMYWYWNLPESLLKDLPDYTGKLSEERLVLEKHLIELYKALLLYQIKSVCSYYRNRGLVLLKDMVKLDNWDADLNAIRDAENYFRHDAQLYTAQQIRAHLEQLVMQQLSEKNKECLRHLRPTEPRDDKKRIELTKGGLLMDLCHWVLDNSEFKAWRDSPGSSILWVKGDPGKGKTMLLCGIIDELECAIVTGWQNCNLAYFFCQATDPRISNATAILRGLIYMLVRQQPPLLSYVRGKYDNAGKSLFEDVNTWVALSEIFTKILKSQDLKKTYIVIDALDECIADCPNY